MNNTRLEALNNHPATEALLCTISQSIRWISPGRLNDIVAFNITEAVANFKIFIRANL